MGQLRFGIRRFHYVESLTEINVVESEIDFVVLDSAWKTPDGARMATQAIEVILVSLNVIAGR